MSRLTKVAVESIAPTDRDQFVWDERLPGFGVKVKFLLHFAGDLHQPLHASDNHDRGGNCVLLSLGGPCTTNLHAWWDTAVVQMIGTDPAAVAAQLTRQITPAQKGASEAGDARSWAKESYAVAKASVYTLNTSPGCGRDAAPVSLPEAYVTGAQAVASLQLERAGVRLAKLLNGALS